MLPSPFPKLLFRSPAGGVAPQAEEDGQSPGWHGKAVTFVQECKKRPVILTGRFLQWQGRGQAVFSPRGVISFPLGSRSRLTIQETGWPGEFCLLHERSDERSPVSFWPGSSHLAAPHPKTGTCMQIRKRGFGREGGKADQGRPSGPCPLRRRKVRASRAGWRENLFSKRFPSPVALLAHSTAGPDRCRAGRLRDRRPDGRGRLRQRPCR